MRKILAWFGFSIQYRDHRGVYSHRYESLDFSMGRPIHAQMSVAFPTARQELIRLSA